MRSIVRAASTAALGILALSLLGGPGGAPATVSLAATATPTAAQQVLALVSSERAVAGRRPVRLDDRLTSAATKHSQDMARNDFFGHVGPDGSTFVSWTEYEAEDMGLGVASSGGSEFGTYWTQKFGLGAR